MKVEGKITAYLPDDGELFWLYVVKTLRLGFCYGMGKKRARQKAREMLLPTRRGWERVPLLGRLFFRRRVSRALRQAALSAGVRL